MDRDRPTPGSFAPVNLTGRRPPIERWAIIATILLVMVVAKPWPSSRDASGSGGGAAPTVHRSAEPAVAASPSAIDDPDTLRVAAFCLDTRTWLVASVERSVERSIDQQIRVWRAMEPATSASGPGDPTIPDVSIVSEGLIELGWCAPIVGDEQPSPPVDMATWLLTPAGIRPMTLDSSRAVTDATPFGAMYRPPGQASSSRAASWPDGTYVFRYREADGRVRWFAIDVETRSVPSALH